ncbi:MAG TPA: Hpt domain-containing protein, partial [Bacillota bacterium]|nr:Hpt domain-containing protein [Bacillota bacterium]
MAGIFPGPRQGKRALKLGIKIAVFLSLIISVFIVAESYYLCRASSVIVARNIRTNLKVLATSFAAALDVEKLKLLDAKADEEGPVYRELQQKLQYFQRINQNRIKYIYVIAKRGQSYYYVLDATPVGEQDHSALGHPFDIKQYPAAAQGFTQPTAETAPVYDKEYRLYSQSGYAPIKDGRGNVIGILGLDMDIPAIERDHVSLLETAGKIIIVAILSALILGVAFSRYITKPVNALLKGFQRVASGDFGGEIMIPRNDEFGLLASSFNNMSGDLQELHLQLCRYNQALEQEVRQRTAELTVVNREMRDIMNHIGLGIITLDRQLKINPQYSRFVQDIFGDQILVDAEFVRLIYPRPEQAEDYETLGLWLQLLFEHQGMTWEELRSIQPVEEVQVGLETESPKSIRLKFVPIEEDTLVPGQPGKLQKVMVIMEDITKTRNLERKIEEKEQEKKDSIEQIVGIIKIDKELFRLFILESNDELAELELGLMHFNTDPNPDTLAELFRMVHTIKGNAANFGLTSISKTAHHLEDLFERVPTGGIGVSREWSENVFKKVDRLKDLLAEADDIYWRIAAGKAKDSGKTRPEKRVSEESILLKISVSDFKDLEERVRKIKEKVLVGQENPELETLFNATERQFTKLQTVRVGRIFGRFRRMIHDISEELGKKVTLEMLGEN